MNNETHELAVQYIRQCERAWVGRPVIAKRDSDGMFHPGKQCTRCSERSSLSCVTTCVCRCGHRASGR